MNVQTILAAKGTAVATIASAATLLGDAVASLRDHGVGALVVSDDGAQHRRHPVRTRRRSLDRHTRPRLVSTPRRFDAMSANVITCQPADTIDKLMAMMTERRIRHLPVLERDGELAGIISIGDVVKFRLDELEQENTQLHDYIEGRV